MNKKATNNNNTIVLEQTVRTLASLNSLLIEASQCKNDNSFIFHILNHTVSYIYYDRAILLNGTGKKILGVSGTSKPATNTLLISNLKNICKYLVDPEKVQIINDDSFSNIPSLWEEYKENNSGTSLLLIPLLNNTDSNRSKPSAPLLILERWNSRPWRENDIKITSPLQKGYSGIWHLRNANSNKVTIKKKGHKILLLLFLVAALASLQAYKISERIVSPCEVVPENPDSITTEIDGVIKEVLVKPGEVVNEGDTLVELTPDIFLEELTSAEQQVKITKSEFARTEAQAVTDMQARGLLVGLENQLKKDMTRLSLAKYRVEKSKIHATKSGVVMMSNPHDWEGKPVMTGERIMLIITPSDNKIEIYLPLDDKIDFPEDAKVKVILNTDSATSRSAHLTYLSEHATVSPNGVPCFLAEAMFDTPVENMRMGVQGTAVIYGKKVSLGYWLIRRPLAAIRNFIGI